MSEQRLRNIYLPPFKAANDAGADTVMCSFNSINGVPGCANPYTETDILKDEWGFDGFIESDYTAVAETRACPPVTPNEGPCGHGTAADGPEAAADALMAGTDSEMVSTNIRDYGSQLLSQRRITKSRLDDAVRRILRIKFRAGLFDHPYVNQAKDTDAVSVLDGIAAQSPGATFAQGCTLSNDEPPVYDPANDCADNGFAEAVAAAKAADQVVLALGETREMSGEAAARSRLDLPGRQQELIDAIKATGSLSWSCCSTAGR